MSNTIPLIFKCQVRPSSPAVITVTMDEVPTEFTVQPTIDWVASSSSAGAQDLTINIDATKLYTDISYNEAGVRLEKTFNFKIQVEGSDVLICGYDALCPFTIVTQPVWNDPEWQPYDITGHGDGLAYKGNGSLQILAGQTVEFTGSIRPGQLVPL